MTFVPVSDTLHFVSRRCGDGSFTAEFSPQVRTGGSRVVPVGGRSAGVGFVCLYVGVSYGIDGRSAGGVEECGNTMK